MALFKCKMCGGDLAVTENQKIAECEYCGSQQTVANADDEKKVNLFNRANRLRMNSEFDKAASIYEQIIAEFPEEAEAYWCLCLSNYGIEYVDDPATAKKIPTCHRASFEKLRKDENYELAIEYSDMSARLVYQDQAKEIDRIMGEILAVSRDEKPYDIFICYKETDNTGSRTPDSVLAQDIYDALTQKGYRVFFSRITLEDKLGTMYEPYIFSALNSAKIMLAVGTDYEYYNAVWVKNEWSRFIKLMAKDKSKLLIPCYKDMDPYDMPDEFKAYQAQDCGKLGFMQDLTRGIDKIFGRDKLEIQKNAPVAAPGVSVANTGTLLERAFMFLEDGKWKEADEYCEKVLDIEPKNATAYLGKLMAELKIKTKDDLKNCAQPFDCLDNCVKASKFDSDIADELKSDNEFIREQIKEKRYNDYLYKFKTAKTEKDYLNLAKLFGEFNYRDCSEKAKECLSKATEAKQEEIYVRAQISMNRNDIPYLESAIKDFESIINWKDSRTKIDECNIRLAKLRTAAEKAAENRKRAAEALRIANEKASEERKREAEKTKIAAAKAAEEQRLAAEKAAEEQRLATEKARKKAKTKKAIKIIIFLTLVAFAVLLFTVIIPNIKLKNAYAELDAGNYDTAYALLEELGENNAINSSKYDRAVSFIDSENIEAAYVLLKQCSDYKDSDKLLFDITPDYYRLKLNKSQVGDTISFGNYYQTNPDEKEEIEWKVLAKHQNKLLVISDKALDRKPYNVEKIDITWETCSLRKWLNGEFFNAAFNAGEQAIIADTKVTADTNPKYKTNPGNDTTDKVFILSIAEVCKYFTSDDAMSCEPTEYTDLYKKAAWWLRSPGEKSEWAAFIWVNGGIAYGGRQIELNDMGVRPAMWIDIS